MAQAYIIVLLAIACVALLVAIVGVLYLACRWCTRAELAGDASELHYRDLAGNACTIDLDGVRVAVEKRKRDPTSSRDVALVLVAELARIHGATNDVGLAFFHAATNSFVQIDIAAFVSDAGAVERTSFDPVVMTHVRSPGGPPVIGAAPRILHSDDMPVPRFYPRELKITTATPVCVVANNYFVAATRKAVRQPDLVRELDRAVLADTLPFCSGLVQFHGGACEVRMDENRQLELQIGAADGTLGEWEVLTVVAARLRYSHDGADDASWLEYDAARRLRLPIGLWCVRAESWAPQRKGEAPHPTRMASVVFTVTHAKERRVAPAPAAPKSGATSRATSVPDTGRRVSYVV
jgi:hypothetical protein